MRLTLARIHQPSLPPGKNETMIFCPSVPGFAVRLRQSGRRTFVFQYRLAGKQKRESLGRADVLPVDEARTYANEMHRAVLVGKDPLTVEVGDVTLGETKEELLHATKIINDELLCGFPLETKAARSVAFAGMLTPHIRASLPTSPNSEFDAASAGTGKTLLS